MPKYNKNTNEYGCSFCKKEYQNPLLAEACEKSHSLIYIAIPKAELMRLIQFIYTGDRDLITEEMVTRLTQYSRVKETQYNGEDLSNL